MTNILNFKTNVRVGMAQLTNYNLLMKQELWQPMLKSEHKKQEVDGLQYINWSEMAQGRRSVHVTDKAMRLSQSQRRLAPLGSCYCQCQETCERLQMFRRHNQAG